MFEIHFDALSVSHIADSKTNISSFAMRDIYCPGDSIEREYVWCECAVYTHANGYWCLEFNRLNSLWLRFRRTDQNTLK